MQLTHSWCSGPTLARFPRCSGQNTDRSACPQGGYRNTSPVASDQLPQMDNIFVYSGCVPPAFELPPITPQCDTPELSDPRWFKGSLGKTSEIHLPTNCQSRLVCSRIIRSPALTTPRTPITTSTPTTIPLGIKDQVSTDQSDHPLCGNSIDIDSEPALQSARGKVARRGSGIA